jgi:hypothetical protein
MQGRSPFEPPELDENGNFILGPNFNHDAAPGYVQDFDSRGHPQNLKSQSYQRRLIRAQNEALSTVGVVVAKAKAKRPWWQSLSDEQKYQIFVRENLVGSCVGITQSIVLKLATTWLTNLHFRFLV